MIARIAPAMPDPPAHRRATILFDPRLRAVWSSNPEFASAGKTPWEFCSPDDTEVVKTAFARCLVAFDDAAIEASFALETDSHLRYRVQVNATGIEGLPVVAYAFWLDARAALLTDRERQVAALTGLGLKSADIAERLHIARSSIDSHRASIRKKLRFEGLGQMVAWAAEQLPPPEQSPPPERIAEETGVDAQTVEPKGHDVPLPESTAEKLGEEFGVEEKAIERDAAFALAADPVVESAEAMAEKAEPANKENASAPGEKIPSPPEGFSEHTVSDTSAPITTTGPRPARRRKRRQESRPDWTTEPIGRGLCPTFPARR